MTVTAALVLYAVLWFLVLFVVLPIRMRSQADAGEVVRGTPASAPAEAGIGRKFRLVTLIALALWAVIAGVIVSGLVTVEDFDLFTRFGGEMR